MYRCASCFLFMWLLTMGRMGIAEELSARAEKVEIAIRKELGISPGALAQLMTVQSGSFVPKRMVEQNGTLQFYLELEEAKMVELRKIADCRMAH